MTTRKKSIRDTLKSERAKAIYDELTQDLAKRLPEMVEKIRIHGGTWTERQVLALEIRKFELDQVRQIVVTASLIDLEELKLLASTSVAVAALNKQ